MCFRLGPGQKNFFIAVRDPDKEIEEEEEEEDEKDAVSYTHLTLPTNHRV